MSPTGKAISPLPAALEAEYRDAFADWAERRGVSESELLAQLKSELGVRKLDVREIRSIILNEWRSNTPSRAHALGEDGPGGASHALKAGLAGVKRMKKNK
jgi:hypothetical protein